MPIADSAYKSAKLVQGAQTIFDPGLPHRLTATHADPFNTDLLAFLRSRGAGRPAVSPAPPFRRESRATRTGSRHRPVHGSPPRSSRHARR